MLGSVGFLWMNLQTLKTRSDGREVAQDSRGKPDGLMVMRKLVVLNAGQFRQTRTIGLTSGWWWGESEKGNQEYPNNSDFWWLNQFSSVTQSCLTICDPMDCNMQASLSITNSRTLLKLMSIESVMPSNHLILCCPLLLLPSIFPSIRVFSKESVVRIRWPKYWSFSFSISACNEYSGLISFRTDWLDLLAVQGSLKMNEYLLWNRHCVEYLVYVNFV